MANILSIFFYTATIGSMTQYCLKSFKFVFKMSLNLKFSYFFNWLLDIDYLVICERIFHVFNGKDNPINWGQTPRCHFNLPLN